MVDKIPSVIIPTPADILPLYIESSSVVPDDSFHDKVNKEDGDYCKDIMKSMCVEYLKNMISKSRAYIDNDIYNVHGSSLDEK